MVGVLEHTVVWGVTPQATIQQNLDIYEQVAKDAASSGVQLLVTPEYGITGFVGSNRNEWFGYAADLPEVPETRTSFCDQASTGGPVPYVLKRLSCMAKQYSMAIVASVVDTKDCKQNPALAECHLSRDGYLLFNTDVVFDSDGAYLAKYHKTNLWGEAAVDAAASCGAKTFRPRLLNITFGVFTCADLIHSWPALHLVSQGVRHFVMPLAWTNEMAQMQPLGWLQSWSLIANATLLAANARDAGKETGSGIFSRGQAIKVAYDLSASSPRQLVVAPLPRLDGDAPQPQACGLPARRPPTPVARVGASTGYQVQRLDMTPGNHSASLCYKMASGAKGVCCQLDYVSAAPGRGFVLAALDGQDQAPGIDPWAAQVCAVMPCAQTTKDCMRFPTKDVAGGPSAFGTFSALQLRASLAAGAQAYPVAVAAPAGVLSTVHSTENGRVVSVSQADGVKDLVSLEVYGRIFSADVPRHLCACGTGQLPVPFEERRYSKDLQLLTLSQFREQMPTTFQDDWQLGPQEKRLDPSTGLAVGWDSRPQDPASWLSWPVALQWRRYPGGEFYTLAEWRSYCVWEAPQDWVCRQYADWRRVWNSLPDDPGEGRRAVHYS